MIVQKNYRPLTCSECTAGAGLGFDFTMAFQPIINTQTKQVFAQEALVRGSNNETAATLFERINESNRYRFDQACRVKAIQWAATLGINTFLSINFMPNAVYQPELCLNTTLAAAERYGFPIERIIFEFTEDEKIHDRTHIRDIVRYYRARGFQTAIDDFGAGYAGLTLLADIQTDIIKLDMALLRHIDREKQRQIIVKQVLQICQELAIVPIAEGIESYEELRTLEDLGVELFQGYYFARPAFQALAKVGTWDQLN